MVVIVLKLPKTVSPEIASAVPANSLAPLTHTLSPDIQVGYAKNKNARIVNAGFKNIHSCTTKYFFTDNYTEILRLQLTSIKVSRLVQLKELTFLLLNTLLQLRVL